MGLAVGVDVGGTKIAAGLVDDDGAIRARARAATPDDDPEAVVDAIAGLVAELVAGPDAGAEGAPVGIGVAGFVDSERRRVLFAPNLGWREIDLAADVEARLDGVGPVVIENDANAAAWAEARFGAGRGESCLVCVTVGTGIGGGIVSDGAVVRGRFGIAGEFGHLSLVAGGLACPCGQYGCWEQYASGSALQRTARDLVASGADEAAALRRACGNAPEQLTGAMVSAAADAGDPAARGLLADLGRWLGAGLATVATVLDPGAFVLGGGVAEIGEALLTPTRESFRRHLPAAAGRPLAQVRVAELGNAAGLVGAADLARGA